MNKPNRVIVIPANLDSPIFTVLSNGYEDLNKYANCEYGTVVDVTGRLQIYTQMNHILSLWIDDEGLLNEKPTNARASNIANQHLVGDAVLTATDMDSGESVDLLKNFCEVLIDNPTLIRFHEKSL